MIQQTDSYIFFFRFFPIIGYHKILNSYNPYFQWGKLRLRRWSDWLQVTQLGISRALRATEYHECPRPDEEPSGSMSWEVTMTVTHAECRGRAQHVECRRSTEQ